MIKLRAGDRLSWPEPEPGAVSFPAAAAAPRARQHGFQGDIGRPAKKARAGARQASGVSFPAAVRQGQEEESERPWCNVRGRLGPRAADHRIDGRGQAARRGPSDHRGSRPTSNFSPCPLRCWRRSRGPGKAVLRTDGPRRLRG